MTEADVPQNQLQTYVTDPTTLSNTDVAAVHNRRPCQEHMKCGSKLSFTPSNAAA